MCSYYVHINSNNRLVFGYSGAKWIFDWPKGIEYDASRLSGCANSLSSPADSIIS